MKVTRIYPVYPVLVEYLLSDPGSSWTDPILKKHGNMKIRKTWKYENLKIRKHGNMKVRKHGNMKIRKTWKYENYKSS